MARRNPPQYTLSLETKHQRHDLFSLQLDWVDSLDDAMSWITDPPGMVKRKLRLGNYLTVREEASWKIARETRNGTVITVDDTRLVAFTRVSDGPEMFSDDEGECTLCLCTEYGIGASDGRKSRFSAAGCKLDVGPWPGHDEWKHVGCDALGLCRLASNRLYYGQNKTNWSRIDWAGAWLLDKEASEMLRFAKYVDAQEKLVFRAGMALIEHGLGIMRSKRLDTSAVDSVIQAIEMWLQCEVERGEMEERAEDVRATRTQANWSRDSNNIGDEIFYAAYSLVVADDDEMNRVVSNIVDAIVAIGPCPDEQPPYSQARIVSENAAWMTCANIVRSVIKLPDLCFTASLP